MRQLNVYDRSSPDNGPEQRRSRLVVEGDDHARRGQLLEDGGAPIPLLAGHASGVGDLPVGRQLVARLLNQ